MADPVREPLYTPNRVYPTRQAEPQQNGLQTFFFGTVAPTPVVNQDFGRPLRALWRRDETPQRRFAFNTPFAMADLGRPIRLGHRADDQLGSNELLFVVVTPSTFIAQFDASAPAKNLWTRADTPLGSPYGLIAQIVSTPVAQSDLSARAQRVYRAVDGPLGVPLQVAFPPPATTPITQPDLSGPPRNAYRRADGPLGESHQARFPNRPFVQPDFSARAQSSYRRVDAALGVSYQVEFPAKPFVRPDLSAPAPNRYKRVDGPLGAPLALMFPAPISVLPHNVFDVATRPVKLRVFGQDVPPLNLQLFPPVAPAAPSGTGRASRTKIDRVRREALPVVERDQPVKATDRSASVTKTTRSGAITRKPRGTLH